MQIELTAEQPNRPQQKQAQADPFKPMRTAVENNLKGVGKILAVHSGKGGVGKSFFAANLAVALAQKGFRAGLLDADVDCPSCHKLMGSTERVYADETQRLEPLERHGIRFLSVGNMVDSGDSANIMRGPIMYKLISEMLYKANWGELDYLVIDLPPGTGDNPLTVMQITPLSGIMVVTQPQEMALADARKSINMARRMGVNVIGIVENMSGEEFGSGGAEETARKLGERFLGRVPLMKSIRELSDAGTPPVSKDKKVREIFESIISKARI